MGCIDRECAESGLAVCRRGEPAGPRGERRGSLIQYRSVLICPSIPEGPGGILWSGHCGDSNERPRCRGAYDESSRERVVSGTPGRPLSAELSEQLVGVAVDILAGEGRGR